MHHAEDEKAQPTRAYGCRHTGGCQVKRTEKGSRTLVTVEKTDEDITPERLRVYARTVTARHEMTPQRYANVHLSETSTDESAPGEMLFIYTLVRDVSTN